MFLKDFISFKQGINVSGLHQDNISVQLHTPTFYKQQSLQSTPYGNYPGEGVFVV
jgi:hypothetical protein